MICSLCDCEAGGGWAMDCDCRCHDVVVHLHGVPDELMAPSAGTLTVDEYHAWDRDRSVVVS